MVCLGNICRSPYAAVALARKLHVQNVRVESGGFIGPDRSSPSQAQTAAASLGVDLSAHKSKIVTDVVLNAHDLIVVMEPAQRRTLRDNHGVPADRILVLGDLDPWPIACRAIGDPYGQPEATFVECYRRIDRCLDTLCRAWAVHA
jgi:protein-tyrosine phosphatase